MIILRMKKILKTKKKKWIKPDITQLKVVSTMGGKSSHSEGNVDKWGNPKPGRVS